MTGPGEARDAECVIAAPGRQRVAPALLLSSVHARAYAARGTAVFLTLAAAAMGVYTVSLARIRNVVEISAPRGRLLTVPWLADPFNHAIRFVVEHTRPGEEVVTLSGVGGGSPGSAADAAGAGGGTGWTKAVRR